jgi:hypothetical protein
MPPLFGEALVPCAVVLTSSEFAEAIPEYSKIAIRKVPCMESDTVITFWPPAIFSA